MSRRLCDSDAQTFPRTLCCVTRCVTATGPRLSLLKQSYARKDAVWEGTRHLPRHGTAGSGDSCSPKLTDDGWPPSCPLAWRLQQHTPSLRHPMQRHHVPGVPWCAAAGACWAQEYTVTKKHRVWERTGRHCRDRARTRTSGQTPSAPCMRTLLPKRAATRGNTSCSFLARKRPQRFKNPEQYLRQSNPFGIKR